MWLKDSEHKALLLEMSRRNCCPKCGEAALDVVSYRCTKCHPGLAGCKTVQLSPEEAAVRWLLGEYEKLCKQTHRWRLESLRTATKKTRRTRTDVLDPTTRRDGL